MQISENFYDNNYKQFSNTRFCLWDIVRDFSNNFKKDSYVLDAGCGNGKNIKYFNDKCKIVGIDKCNGLVDICKKNGYNVIQSDIKSLPFEDNTFDFSMSIAVIHHLDKEEDRVKAVNELLRVIKPGGKLLITVWAFENDDYSKKKKFDIGDNIVKWNDRTKISERYYYIYNKLLFNKFCSKIEHNSIISYDRGNWNCIFIKN
jgi:SAM-dependent methyltransferase